MSKESDQKNFLESLEDRMNMLEKNLSAVANKLEEHLKWGRPTNVPDYKESELWGDGMTDEERKRADEDALAFMKKFNILSNK
jgi:hypothetical protein